MHELTRHDSDGGHLSRVPISVLDLLVVNKDCVAVGPALETIPILVLEVLFVAVEDRHASLGELIQILHGAGVKSAREGDGISQPLLRGT